MVIFSELSNKISEVFDVLKSTLAFNTNVPPYKRMGPAIAISEAMVRSLVELSLPSVKPVMVDAKV